MRDIVFSYLLDNDFDLIKSELFIWHKPSISKTDRHYFKIDINKAVLQVNKELMKLYEYRRKPGLFNAPLPLCS